MIICNIGFFIDNQLALCFDCPPMSFCKNSLLILVDFVKHANFEKNLNFFY